MVGVFVQLNLQSQLARARPLGYLIQGDGCWEWVGRRCKGYGRWDYNPTGENRAHRAVYVMLRGPIPTGLQIDHLCRNRACVNPDHLEPVTPRENVLRGQSLSRVYAARTHCGHGHAFDAANTLIGKNGARYCRQCGLRRCREQRARNLARYGRTRLR